MSLIILIIALRLFIINPPTSNILKPVSSEKHQIQKEILTYKEMDSVLNTLEKIPYDRLNREYLIFSGYEDGDFDAKMCGKTFYKIEGSDGSKNLVGKFQVIDFLPKDRTYYRNLSSIESKAVQYLCIDNDLLHKFLDLILMLDNWGYDKYAFIINDGFRYPNFNHFTGGALLSQHIYGVAIDLAIGDINKDGKFDEDIDKKIVLHFLENYIIKNDGGVGRYPKSNVVHFDTRGYYKRWDVQ